MAEIVNFSSIKHFKKKREELRNLDITASYISLEQCLFVLNISSLPETEQVKLEIQKALKKLKENAKKESYQTTT